VGFPRPQQLTVAQQAMLMRHSSWVRGEGRVHCGVLRWEFAVRPSVAGREYLVNVEYRQHGVPNVVVRAPDLVALAENRKLPHVYSQDPVRLCLYLPGSAEWHRGLSLATTIVPWTYLWLDYFEEWLVSNEWQGGGMHPTPARQRRRLH
jgi:hypothetical protein